MVMFSEKDGEEEKDGMVNEGRAETGRSNRSQ